jgi:hypothetical protein
MLSELRCIFSEAFFLGLRFHLDLTCFTPQYKLDGLLGANLENKLEIKV